MRANNLIRRNLLKAMLGLPALFASGMLSSSAAYSQRRKRRQVGVTLKISLNAYSFNDALSKGTMTIDDLLEYCAITGFDAVDLTGYYFPGYPLTPPDEYIYHVKRRAFLLGLDISGTGVRNDFTSADETKRKEDVRLVKNWIECASKLGAPVIRIFSGTQNPAGFSREQVLEWMVRDIKECVDYGKQHGVTVAIQNHNDFIKTAEDTKKIMELVNDKWFGLILDIGSYRSADPYAEIEQMVPYAVSWQLKENMYVGGVERKTDVDKIVNILRSSGYRGYLPIETLGPGEPKVKVALFLEKVRKALDHPHF